MEVNYKNQKRYKTAKYPIRQPLFFVWLIWVLSFFALLFKKKKIENDMLRAIMIMNSAFKSGKSTIQAVEIASEKLRMYNVLSRKMQQVVCLKWNF